MTIKLVEFDDHTADLQAEVATLRNALRHIIDRHDTEAGDAVTVQIARKALGS